MRIVTDIDEQLRRVPRDPRKVREALEESREQLEYLRERVRQDATTLNTTRLGRHLQRHGRLLRFAGRRSEAVDCKTKAIEIWREYGRERAHFLCRLQRCAIRGEAGDVDQALDELVMLRKQLDERTGVYRDMLEETLGTCHYRCGDYARALEALGRALQIRRQRGNQRHIEDTQRIIDVVVEANRNDCSE